jgi:quercetin dioxygenase-like cupin family protein
MRGTLGEKIRFVLRGKWLIARLSERKGTITMQPATGMTQRRTLTRGEIALLCIFGICIPVVALATPGSGVLSNSISRATVPAFETEATVEAFETESRTDGQDREGWKVEIETKGVSDIVTQTITLGRGGSSGWHSHPGPAIVSVKSGTVTFYHGDDRSCTPHVFSTGTGFVEPGGDIHIARNEGTEDLTLNVTYIVPHGAPQRIDQPSPGNCAF